MGGRGKENTPTTERQGQLVAPPDDVHEDGFGDTTSTEGRGRKRTGEAVEGGEMGTGICDDDGTVV